MNDDLSIDKKLEVLAGYIKKWRKLPTKTKVVKVAYRNFTVDFAIGFFAVQMEKWYFKGIEFPELSTKQRVYAITFLKPILGERSLKAQTKKIKPELAKNKGFNNPIGRLIKFLISLPKKIVKGF